MSLLLAAYRITGLALLVAIATVVALQLANGTINTRGLISEKGAGANISLSPARAQLLISTVAVAALYVYRVATSARGASLPDIPGSVLAFVSGSQLTYVVGKALTVFSAASRSR